VAPAVCLTFDVEEHHRIEAAAALDPSLEQKRIYADLMAASTRQILALLAKHDAKATFFIVGEIALSHPDLVREIAAAGHEIGSHSHDHRRVHRFDRDSFRDDLLRSKDALENASGTPVVGFRAPTFSIMTETNWALDVLAECGFAYDSSIFPIAGHDRYGVPHAPRTPFLAQGPTQTILELPPATYRFLGRNLPVAGGGYFRLFPPFLMHRGIRQLLTATTPPLAMLYFHPWEFDPDQPKLPLSRMSRFRTYVGIGKSMARLESLMVRYKPQLKRAVDAVAGLRGMGLARI
jgi:polysaccharide deacetylase family protein (PEP-CTERM system associated)